AADLIRSARKRIILIDNYIDDSVLLTLAKRKEGVAAEIVTRHVTETLKLDLERHNRQVPRTVPYPTLRLSPYVGLLRWRASRAATYGHRITSIGSSAHEHRFIGAPNCETQLAPNRRLQ
ncbi:MAG: hypothetical protein K5885_08385, partial [Bacteroidales bacterium]|nr:hypothetical protein [Bacteroidales bacterium]